MKSVVCSKQGEPWCEWRCWHFAWLAHPSLRDNLWALGLRLNGRRLGRRHLHHIGLSSNRFFPAHSSIKWLRQNTHLLNFVMELLSKCEMNCAVRLPWLVCTLRLACRSSRSHARHCVLLWRESYGVLETRSLREGRYVGRFLVLPRDYEVVGYKAL